MTDSPTPRRSLFAVWHWPRWKQAAVIVPLLLISYPLSMGPVEWCWQRGMIPLRMAGLLAEFYRPVLLAADQYPPASRALYLYVEWWGNLAHK